MLVGVVFGPYVAKIFEPAKFDGTGSTDSTDVSAITLVSNDVRSSETMTNPDS